MPQISEKLKGSFTKIFGTVEQKIFVGNLWYPLLCIKFFGTPNFLRHWREAHEIFRHCETKNFRRKFLILPPPSLIQTLSVLEISETLKVPLRNFRHCEIKNFRRKILILPHPLLFKFFQYPKLMKHSRLPTPYGNFRHCETTKIRWKVLKLPPPLLSINFFATGTLLKHGTEGFTYQIFWHCETKKIDRIS